MFLWLMAFWLLGYVALPGGLELLGLEREELTARGQVRACMHPHPSPIHTKGLSDKPRPIDTAWHGYAC